MSADSWQQGAVPPMARGNPYRLMDGENPDSLQPADAKHWVSIYLELLAFKRKLLDHMHQDLLGMSAPRPISLTIPVASS